MPEQTAHPSDEKLNAYNRGLLSPDEAVAIETHISDCEPCCETIVSLSSDDTFVGLLKEARQLPIDQTLNHDSHAAKPSSSHGDIPAELAKHPKYEIVRLIGKGGMGDVYEAIHRKMERRVALKVINRELFQKAEAVNRFHREVKAAAQLSHPNIVTSHDADQAGDFHFMVMEFVDGVDLSQIVKDQGALPVADACDYIRQAATGLQHAHERGMVHRDIKPHNLMATADGTIKILDFGLASLAPEALPASDAVAAISDLTAAGTIMGTPDFISPEQANDARQVDIRSDIYSLGATLYYLLSGRVPFADGSVMHKLKSHAQVEPAPLNSVRDDVPEKLVAIASKMMAKDPDERYLTPSEVADALESFLRTYRPNEAESPRHELSGGGNMSGSGGQTSGANDMSPDWIPVLGKWLFYMSLIPIALLVLDTFFWSDEASDAPDRTMFYIGTSVALSTIGGILAGIHQFNTGNRDNHRENRWSEGQTMLIGFIILGAGAFYLFQTDHGVVRIAINDPSLHVSILGQTITMDDGVEKPLTITPGEWPLLVSKEDAGFRFHTDSFRLRRGDEITFKVEVLKDEIVVLKDGEPFDRQEIFDLRRELQDADDRSPASTSPSKPELKVTGKTVNKGTAGLPSLYDWSFKGRDVGDLKVRLLLAQNGKSEVMQEFDFEELPAEFANKVRLQVKDAARSPKGRRVNAVLFVESPVPSSSATVNEDRGLSIDVEAPFSNKMERSDLEPIEPGQTELLLALSYWKGDMTHDLSMESMTAATKDGNVTFVFVTLDWSPTFVPTINGKVTERILDRMKKTYAQCKSYRDSGVIKSVFLKNTVSPEFTVEYSFDTAFVRPDRFRFEIKDQYDDKLLISADGEDVQTSWDIESGNQKPESLELAMAQAVGFTGGDVSRIPAMLMPKKLDGWVDLDLIDPRQVEDGRVQNAECFRLEYSFRDEQVTLWIDKQSYLVRRIDERIKADDVRIERTTTYDPTIDGKITDQMLEFDPLAPRAADDSANTLPDEDFEQLQGDWETESLAKGGKQLSAEDGFGSLLLQIRGNTFVIAERKPNGEKSEVNTGRIEINSTTSPKTIDFIGRAELRFGIYDFKDGVLRICLVEQGGTDAPAGARIPDTKPLKRPTTFDSPAGSNKMFMEFRRTSENTRKVVTRRADVLGMGKVVSFVPQESDKLATIDLNKSERAVELWVSGDDAKLVQEGDRVRLEFEGWPAAEPADFFGGKVISLDPTADGAGMFRVLIKGDDSESWPDKRYLRPGVRANCWIFTAAQNPAQ